MARQNFSSGAPLEEKVGYSRMVRVGNQVFIGGTTSVQPDGHANCLTSTLGYYKRARELGVQFYTGEPVTDLKKLVENFGRL